MLKTRFCLSLPRKRESRSSSRGGRKPKYVIILDSRFHGNDNFKVLFGRRIVRRSFYLLFLMSFFLSSSVAVAQISKKGKEIGMKEVREPVFAGSWYPGNPEVLSRDIQRYLGDAKKEKVEGEVVSLVSPHAGYMYSGRVAAYAYQLLEGKHFDSVVVVAPSHQALFKGASLYDRGGYRTPLGVVPIDVELSKRLMERRKENQ